MSIRKIKLPEKFEEKLKDSKEEAIVNKAFIDFFDILDDNKLTFFEDYTNHGIQHIEDVLNTAANLITDESYKYLNPKDIAVLSLAVLLHDLGMHISDTGLQKLLSDEYEVFRVKDFDTNSWNEEWTEFFQEAKRFNDKQLQNIFGDINTNIVEPNIHLLGYYDRKIYGEFLRRHHHRLAHEMAIGGFPTKLGEKNIVLSESSDSDLLNLIGVVARSHGMSLRNTFNHLNQQYDDSWKAPYNIKIVFLMVVLRIADYIQIHAERASEVLIKTKRFQSPISKQEWEKHGAIKEVNTKHDDPERIYVRAEPKSSIIYLELSSLFKDIQYEFDLSWAILGEVYGNYHDYKNLKIKYRRITSNIDDKKKFFQKVNFVPEKITFTSDSELLKLLIGPLYGEDPKYGVRELLQNAVDAIKERSHLTKQDYGKVTISIEPELTNKNCYEFTIIDQGIGMSQDTIINYFFRAGASFRKSMVWKKNFIDENEVQIQKTGRFGVGVLAVFLLGDEFEMCTKHYLESEGFYCKASLSSNQIELEKYDCEVGTKIKIKLNDNSNKLITKLTAESLKSTLSDSNRLDWFTWYFMDAPNIVYKLSKNLKNIFKFNNSFISSISSEPTKGWHHLKTKDYRDIYFSFYNKNAYTPALICNGFKIPKAFKIDSFSWGKLLVSVFDGNGKFPLSLNRDYIIEDKLPFEEELIQKICDIIIDSLLTITFTKHNGLLIPNPQPIYFSEGFTIWLDKFIIVSQNKFTLLAGFIIDELKMDRLTEIWLKPKLLHDNAEKITGDMFYKAAVISNDPNYFYQRNLDISYMLPSTKWFNIGEDQNIYPKVTKSFIPTSKQEHMYELSRLSKSFKTNAVKQDINDKWIELTNDRRSLYSPQQEKQKFISRLNKNLLDANQFYLINEHSIEEMVDKQEFFKKNWIKRLGENWCFEIRLK